jgi:hypothetical protein
MPEEPVATKWGTFDAYLIESRSIGGLSGSPVFAYIGPVRRPEGGSFNVTGVKIFLLGLVHGHWDLPLFETDDVQIDSDIGKSINRGIAIVVPSQKIAELLNCEKLTGPRATYIAEQLKLTASSTFPPV